MKNLKIKLNKKVSIIFSIMSCLILIFGIYLLRHPIFCYEKDYFGKVGLPRAKLYESVVEKMVPVFDVITKVTIIIILGLIAVTIFFTSKITSTPFLLMIFIDPFLPHKKINFLDFFYKNT